MKKYGASTHIQEVFGLVSQYNKAYRAGTPGLLIAHQNISNMIDQLFIALESCRREINRLSEENKFLASIIEADKEIKKGEKNEF